MSSFRFGTVGSPLATPKKPGGSVGGVMYSAELGLAALELGWVQSVRVSEQTCLDIRSASAADIAPEANAPLITCHHHCCTHITTLGDEGQRAVSNQQRHHERRQFR